MTPQQGTRAMEKLAGPPTVDPASPVSRPGSAGHDHRLMGVGRYVL